MIETQTTLGELISLFYQEYMAIYGDEELASVATAASINDLLTQEVALARSDQPEKVDAA